MYDLIIIGRELNKKKVIAIICAVIIMVIIATIIGMNAAEAKIVEKYSKELNNQQTLLEEREKQRQIEEEEARQAEIKAQIDKISKPLTDEQINNILHIYNSTGIKRVFITFDDGPSEVITPLILDVLKQYNVKATFFVLGNKVNKNPELAKREFEEGHYIANHGYSHEYADIYSSPEATLNEFNLTEQAIRNAIGNQLYSSRIFRFPGGSTGGKYHEAKQYSKNLLLENRIAFLDWNSLSEDAVGQKTKEELLENVKVTMGNKDSVVILMHDSNNKVLTYEMLPELIEYLSQQGYTFQTLYDLL